MSPHFILSLFPISLSILFSFVWPHHSSLWF
jgi:hypothetical protein